MDAATKPAKAHLSLRPLDGNAGLFKGRRGGGEDRLVQVFCVLSLALHLVVLFIGPISWLRNKPVVNNEWSMDVDLLSEVALPPPPSSALPQAAPAPAAKAPPELLPQLPKTFTVKQATKAEEAVAEVKEPPKLEPKTAPVAPEPKKAEETPPIRPQENHDNEVALKELQKRKALDALRQQEKTAKTTEAPEDSPLARLAEQLDKSRKADSAFGSASSKGRVKSYLALLRQAVRSNYSVPEAYHLQEGSLRVTIAITLSDSGQLLDLQVKDSSGNGAFDDLTVQAVKASVPFPKPPAEVAGEAISLVFTPKMLQN